MNKSIFCLAALILASPAFSGELRIHSTRDSGGYEASLRLAGIPLSGGMAWGIHNQGASAALQARRTGGEIDTAHAAVTKPAKAG